MTKSCRDPLSEMFRRSVPPVLLSRLLQEGERSYVFRGHFGKTPIVAKIAAEVQSLISRLSPPRIRNLHSLQGCGIPRCFGLFHLGDFAKVLLMEYCGRSIDSFDDLSPEQSNTLDRVVSVMEQHGVRHDDLEPRNILVSDSGDVFVIDFEMVSSIEPDSFRSTPSQTTSSTLEQAFPTLIRERLSQHRLLPILIVLGLTFGPFLVYIVLNRLLISNFLSHFVMHFQSNTDKCI